MGWIRSRACLSRPNVFIGLAGPPRPRAAVTSVMHTATRDNQSLRPDPYSPPKSASQRSTIFALATPPGRGGIGVVRISGPDASKVWKHMLVSHRTGKSMSLPGKNLPRQLFRCRIVHPVTGDVIDDGMAVYFRGKEQIFASAAEGCYNNVNIMSST